MPALFRRWFAAANPDGTADALAAHVTGVTPDALTAALPTAFAAEASVSPKRQRLPDDPRTQLTERLGAKVLHDWLQNRHQILFPLALNLRTLAQDRACCLAQMAAVALLANGQASAEFAQELRRFLGTVKADDIVLAAFDAALQQPPTLDALMAAIEDMDLGAYAFIVSVVATDQRKPVGRAFTAYLAARLHLPDTVISSATRRYRR